MSNTTHIDETAYHQLTAIEKAGYREVWQYESKYTDTGSEFVNEMFMHMYKSFLHYQQSYPQINTRRIYIPIQPETVKEERFLVQTYDSSDIRVQIPATPTTEERANKLWDEIPNTPINDPFEFDLSDAKLIKAVDEEQLITIPLWQAKNIEDCFRIVANHLNSKSKKTSMDRDIMQAWQWVKNAIAGESDKRVFRS